MLRALLGQPGNSLAIELELELELVHDRPLVICQLADYKLPDTSLYKTISTILVPSLLTLIRFLVNTNA